MIKRKRLLSALAEWRLNPGTLGPGYSLAQQGCGFDQAPGFHWADHISDLVVVGAGGVRGWEGEQAEESFILKAPGTAAPPSLVTY